MTKINSKTVAGGSGTRYLLNSVIAYYFLEVDAVGSIFAGRCWSSESQQAIGEGEKPPSFLAVINAIGYAYTRPVGVHVIPIGCLRE